VDEIETEHSGENRSTFKLEKDDILNRVFKLEGQFNDNSGRNDRICTQLRQIFHSTGSAPSDCKKRKERMKIKRRTTRNSKMPKAECPHF